MKTKCKYFYGNEAYTLEYSINKFLEANTNIEVVALSHAVDTHDKYTAILIYKEPKKTGGL